MLSKVRTQLSSRGLSAASPFDCQARDKVLDGIFAAEVTLPFARSSIFSTGRGIFWPEVQIIPHRTVLSVVKDTTSNRCLKPPVRPTYQPGYWVKTSN